MMEMIDLVNSVIIFLYQITLLRWLTFLLGSQTVILIVLLFWIYFFLLALVFALQWLSLIKHFFLEGFKVFCIVLMKDKSSQKKWKSMMVRTCFFNVLFQLL